jgi:hypothetical protein
MLNKRSAELRKFLTAFALGWLHYASHPNQANAWFVREARLDVSMAVLDKSASVEPNVGARKLSELRLDFNEQDLVDLKGTADFLFARGIIQKMMDPVSFVDTRMIQGVVSDAAIAEQVRRLSAKP